MPGERMRARLRQTEVQPGSPFGTFLNVEPQPRPLDSDMHLPFEIGVLTVGKLEWHYQDAMRIMMAGDVNICAPWEPHAWRVLEPGTSSVHWEFLPEGLGDLEVAGRPWPTLFTLHPRDRPSVRTPRMREELLTIARAAQREVEERRPAWLEATRLYLLQVLFVLAREWELPAEYQQRPLVYTRDLDRIMPALRLVEDTPTRRISQEEAAAACALSVSQFGRVFRHASGVSFGRFALRTRLARAARLLLHTPLSVEAIASETGFVDGSHLYRVFPKYYRVSPAEYREHGSHGSSGEPPTSADERPSPSRR